MDSALPKRGFYLFVSMRSTFHPPFLWHLIRIIERRKRSRTHGDEAMKEHTASDDSSAIGKEEFNPFPGVSRLSKIFHRHFLNLSTTTFAP